MNLQRIILQLEHRRTRLGMSCADVAKRGGVGLRTVQRTLTGEDPAPELATVHRIAQALGASVQLVLEGQDVDEMKRARAMSKAAELVALTQGTSALEAQAVPEGVLKRLREQTTMKLLCGSARKLWAD